MNERPDLSSTIRLRDRREIVVRPLQADDVEPLTAYFESLSAETRRRYGPHPFDRVTAQALCAQADDTETIRFVALDQGAIVGYMILTRDIWGGDVRRLGDRLRRGACAALAPSIADSYQGQGIGARMGDHVLACARRLGFEQVILMGGVQAANLRARGLYVRLGFRRVGEFWTRSPRGLVLNYSMVTYLDGREEPKPCAS